MEYIIILKDLPCTIKALTIKNDDETYTIFVNSRLNYEQQHKSFQHELQHIQNCDFEKVCVDKIEYNAHREGYNGTV